MKYQSNIPINQRVHSRGRLVNCTQNGPSFRSQVSECLYHCLSHETVQSRGWLITKHQGWIGQDLKVSICLCTNIVYIVQIYLIYKEYKIMLLVVKAWLITSDAKERRFLSPPDSAFSSPRPPILLSASCVSPSYSSR